MYETRNMHTGLDALTLALLPGFTPRLGAVLRARSDLGAILEDPGRVGTLLPEAARRALCSGEARQRAESEWSKALAAGLLVVTWGDPSYPEWLAHVDDAPPALFVSGRLVPGEGERAVAVVGSRAATPHGLAFARTLGRDLARLGLTVVSGLARGIDAAAHRGALEAGGRTVAVLGSGLLDVYPAENAPLAAEIARTGAVVSEFALDAGPWKGHFPRRNRVIAGWGRGVVVVEAAEKSGALITASLAQEGGREVLAVPGHPLVRAAAGSNGLLRDGAAVVRHARDVLDTLGLEAPRAEATAPGGEIVDDDVLASLSPGVPASLEEIAHASGRPVPELLARLGSLEVQERVRRLPGPLFMRS